MKTDEVKKLGDLKSDNLSEKDRRNILALFNKNELEHDVKNELIDQLDNWPDDNNQTEGAQAMFDRLWKRVQATKQNRKTIKLNPLYWAAAVLLLGFFIGNRFSSIRSLPEQESYFISKASPGSVSETILPDGSVIFLNAGSEIKYVVRAETGVREVHLVGEAWFNVEKSKEVPFVVHTSFYDIRVMGTEFNVKAYPDDDQIITTLEKGSIEVLSSDKLKLAENIQLKPGEQLVFDKIQRSVRVNQVSAEIFSGWKDNRLTFIDMGLGELAKLLGRKYGVNITILDTDLMNYHYDGTIKNETIIDVLNILQKTLPINYRIEGQNVIIMKK